MPDDEIERILSTEQEMEPSPMFAAKVMGAVRREAATPPPIAFPWKWAVPGLAALVVAIALGVMELPSRDSAASQVATTWMDAARHLGLGWVGLALTLTFVVMAVTRRLTSD
jgi:hypothetical protein